MTLVMLLGGPGPSEFTSGTLPFRSEMGVLGGGLSQPLPFPDSRHTRRAFPEYFFFGKNWKKKRTEKTLKNRAVQKLLFSLIFGLSELSLSNFHQFWVNFGTPRTLFFDFFGRSNFQSFFPSISQKRYVIFTISAFS